MQIPMPETIFSLHIPAFHQEKSSIKLALHSFESKGGWEPLSFPACVAQQDITCKMKPYSSHQLAFDQGAEADP